jgi:RNA polymerase-binding transcription factor DksA
MCWAFDLGQGFPKLEGLALRQIRRIEMTTHRERKAALEARLRQLRTRLEGIDGALKSHTDADWEELAVKREDDEMLEGMGVSGQQEIRMIEAALQRLHEGNYGFCRSCGEAISAERLDLLPATPFCRNCAER